MSGAIQIFTILAVLLLAQSITSLRDGFRFLDHFRRSRTRPPGDYTPSAAVIIPVTGADAAIERNLLAFLSQDYPKYQVIFVVEDEHDPAFPIVRALAAPRAENRSPGAWKISVVAAGAAARNGQKVHNLLQALQALEGEVPILAFADADARSGVSWLRNLVAPLADSRVTVSTGFRWYLPGKTCASRLRAAWDTSIAMLLREHDAPFPWGGSMAIRSEEFRRMRVAERYWTTTVSDDYSLGRAVRDHSGRIRFQPRCLLASREDTGFGEFLRWSTRQIIITRVYAPHLWRLGLAAHLLYAGTYLFGLGLLVACRLPAPGRLGILAFLAVIVALGVEKGRIRSTIAREAFPEESESLAQHGRSYWQLAPLVPWVMLWNFISAGFTRSIEWGGIRYRLRSPSEVEILGREPV